MFGPSECVAFTQQQEVGLTPLRTPRVEDPLDESARFTEALGIPGGTAISVVQSSALPGGGDTSPIKSLKESPSLSVVVGERVGVRQLIEHRPLWWSEHLEELHAELPGSPPNTRLGVNVRVLMGQRRSSGLPPQGGREPALQRVRVALHRH